MLIYEPKAHSTLRGLRVMLECIVSSYFRNVCRVLGRALWSHAGVREGRYNPLQRPFAPFASSRETLVLSITHHAKTRRETGDLYIEDDNKHEHAHIRR
jgi:hypothetical protein